MLALRRVFLVIVFLASTISLAQATTSVGKKSNYIKKIVDRYHFLSVSFDDTFSEKVISRFIKESDPNGMYLYQSDINELKANYATVVDDEIKQSKSAFFDAFAAVFESRLTEAKNRLIDFETKSIDWKKQEAIAVDPKNEPVFVQSESEMKERWRKYFKLAVLEELFSDNQHPRPLETTLDSILEYEQSARDEVLKLSLIHL